MSEGSGGFGQLRLICRISLWFAVLALVALVALFFIAGTTSSEYLEEISRLSVTRKQLPVLMAIGGLVLAITTALTIWSVALYSSFRVAGPLYRFCLDLEDGIRTGQVPRIRIRQSDYAQDEARHLEASVAALYRHYDELSQALDEAAQRLQTGTHQESRAVLERIRQLSEKVRI